MARGKSNHKWTPNALFRSGPIPGLNACVGENGGPYDLVDYGKGFFEGAQEIVEALKTKHLLIDVLVYPVCFAFRHGIELYLKAILKIAVQFNDSGLQYEKNHSIEEYWAEIRIEFEKLDDCVLDRTEISIASDLVADFVKIDPTGQVFRYPEDIRGNKHLSGLKIINVEVLSDGMKLLHQLLDHWYYRIEDLLEQRRQE
jgi:hypothetical protein